jgi:hypothetical protein
MTAAAGGVAGVLVAVTAAGEKNHLREENGIRGRTSLLALMEGNYRRGGSGSGEEKGGRGVADLNDGG